MIRLRSVGRLPCPDGKVGSHSWVLDLPRSGSVVIFNSKHACQRDAFTGAALAEGPVPVPPTDSSLFAEGAAAAAPLDDFDIDAKSAACVVQGATGPLMVVFSPHYCALGVLHLPSGTIRDLLPLRLTSRGPGRSSLSLVTCITGSRHRGSAGIVFIGRAGQPTVQAVRVDPPELVGSTGTSLHSNGCVIAAACHPSKALLALSLSNGIIQLWDFSALCTDAQGSAADIGGGGGGAAASVGGGGGGGDMDIASPTSSPKARTAKSVSGDDRVPVRPQLTGRMKLVGKLATQTIPGCEPPQDGSSSGTVFEHLAFHPSREWVCAAASVGCVGVWNLEGEDLSGGDAGGGGARQRSTIGGDMDDASDFGADQEDYDASYAPADARVHAVRAFAGALMPPSASGQPSVAACAFHPVEALVVVVRGAPAAAGGGGSSGAPTHEIALLSLLDAGLPCLYSVPLPAQPASVCVDAVSARAFITWSGGGGGEDAAAAAAAAAAGGAAGLHTRCDVVALSGGALLGRGHHSIVGAPAAVPPWAFVDAAAAAAVPAPLQCHLLRSMPVLIKAGPGGGADIPAVKAVLYSQALERDVAAKDRAKPRRLITLPGHTDDVMRSARGEGFSRGGRFLSGHLQPYRLVPGPLLDGTRRCFLVLYEVVGPPEDTPPGGALPWTEALAGASHTVCGLAIQAAKGEQETEANLRPLMAASDACFAGGHRLSVYVLPAMAFVISMEVAIPIARVFPTPTWLGPARGQVLYVVRRPLSSPLTVPADGALQFDEALVYSVPGGLKCPLLAPGTAAPLQLGRHEHVVDVQFQPLAAAADAQAWGCGGAPLVAVLTNKRVIVARAATLAAVAHSATASHAHAPAGTLPPAVQSIAWLGSAVACALDDGQIAYLAPRSDIVGGSSSGGGGSGDGGARLVQLVPKPLLCVDRVVCAGGVAIAAVLPDRVCYLVRGSSGSGIVHMVTRPLMPLEALVSGLLAYAPAAPSGVTAAAAAAAALQQQQPPCRGHARLQALRRRQRQRLSTRATLPAPQQQQQQAPLPSAVAAALRLVVARHAPPRAQHAGVPAGEGAGLSAGATSEAFRLLAARGLPDLACHVAGVSLSDTFGLRGSADLFFRHRPWVPPGERARAAARAGLPLNAALEAAGDDPALHDYVLDSDAMITAQLPARGSALARAWRAFAAQARAAGRLDTARRLLELAGDDAALALLLSSVALEPDENSGDSGNGGGSGGGGDGGNRETALEHLVALRGALKAAGVVADPLVLAAAEAVINKAGGAAPLSAADPLVAALLLRGDPAVGALFRRASLLAGLDPLSDVPPAAGVPPPPKPLVTGDALPLGLPPPTVLKPLALNTLGQWLGRCRPECMEPYGGGGAAAAAAAADDSRAAATATAAVPESGSGSGGGSAAVAGGGYDDDDRSSWVTVGGQWNAEDNVCGYWRFSEGAAPATAAAAAAGAAIDLQDLSKFKNAAAVRGGAALEETTSPTDPGDRGKVAPAYDLCFSAEAPTAAAAEGAAAARGRQPPYARGMFVPCRRGCAVDLGAFHDDARRCCFTLEMWVKMGPSSAAEADDDSDGDSAAAAAAAAGGGLGQYGAAYHVLAARYSLRGAQQHLWSLSVEGNGQLVFIPGPRARAELAADTDITRGAVATPPGAIPAGRWVHVALTLDASREETAAEAVLYVDCARCAEGAVRFARVARGTALAETELAVGADVRGWRVAEVRLWAMLRDAQALQDLREVYLGLAEQKKGRIVIRSAAAAAAVMSPVVGIAPPSGGAGGAGGGSEGRKSVVPLSLIKPPVVSPGPSRLSTPTVSSDPRKARLAATVASPPLAGGGAGAASPGGAVTTAESSPMSVQSPGAAAAPSAASPAAALPPVPAPALVAPPTGAAADPRKARLQRRPSAAPEAGAAAVRAVEARGSGVPATAPAAATEAADDGWAAFSGTVPTVAVAMAAATGAAVTASALLHRGSASPPPPPAAAAAADGWAAFGSSSPKPGGAMSAAAGSAPEASPSSAAAADAASWAAFDVPTSPMAAATSPFSGATAGASDAWAAFGAPPSTSAAPEGSAGAAAAAAHGAAAAPLAAASAADGDGWAAFGSPSPTPRAFSVPRPPGSSASAAAAAAAAASGAPAEWVQFGSPKTPARFREASAPGGASAGAAAGDSWDAFGVAAAAEEAPAAATAAAAAAGAGDADAGAAQAAAAAPEVAAATSAQSTAAAAEKSVSAAPAAAASVATMPAAVAAAVATVAAAVEEKERRPSAAALPDRRPSGIASPDKIRARSGSGDDVARAQRKSSSEMLAQPAGGRPGLAAPRDSRKAALEARRQRQAAVAAAAAAELALEEKNAAVVAAAKYEDSLKAKAGSPMALEARQRREAAVAAAAVAAAALDEKNAAAAKAVEAEAVAAAVSAAVPGTAGAPAAATAALDRRSSGESNSGVAPGEAAAAAAPGEREAAAREAATAMQAATAEAAAASSVSVGALSVSAGVDNGAGTPATIFSPPTAAGESSTAPWGAFGDFGSGGGDVASTPVAAAGGGASSTGAQPEAAALPVPAARESDAAPSGWSSFDDLSPVGGDAFTAGLASSGNAQGAGGGADATSGISAAAAAASMPLSAASVPPARAGAGWAAFGAFGAGGDGSGSGAAAAVAPPAAPPGGASAAEWAAFGEASVGGSTKANGATGTVQLPAADPAAAAVEWPAFGAPPSAALAAFASPPQPPPSAASSVANAALPAAVVDPLAWAPTSPPSFAGVSGGGGGDWDAFGSPTSPAVAAAGFGASAPSSAAAAGGAEAAAAAAAWSAQWEDPASDPFKAASPPKGAGAQDAGAKARSSSNGGGGGSVSTATVAGGASGAAAAPLTTAASAPAAAAAGDQAAESPGALTSAVLGAGAAVAAAAAGAAAVTAGSRSRQSSLSVQVPAAAAAAEAAPAEAEAPPPAGGLARRNSGIMCIGAVTPVLRLTPAVTAAEVAASHAMSALLSNSARYVCVTHRSSTGGGGSGDAGSGETVASLKVFDLQASSVTRYPINAENAIMRPGAAAERIIALYLKAAGGGPCRFNIFSMDNRGQKLKDQPMAAALLLWRWLDGATLALVTHASVFYWNTHGAAKPVKAFDRRHTLSALSPKSPAQQAAALTVTGGTRPPLLFYCCSAPAALGDDAGQWGLLRAVAHAGSGADAAAAAVTVDLHDLQRQRTYGLRAAGAAFITWPLPCDAAAATAGTAASQALAIVVTTAAGASLRVLDLAAPPRDGYDETAADALGDSVSAEGAPLHQGWSDLFGYELTARGDGSRQFWVLQSPRLPAALVCVHETGTVQVLLFSAAGGVPRVHRMRACEGAVLDACVDDSGDLLVATAAAECAVVKVALIGADAE